MLDSNRLEQFEAQLVSAGAPVVNKLAPGLSPADADRLTRGSGITLPTEPRLWWGWHNGITGGPAEQEIGPGVDFLSLEQALDARTSMNAIAEHGRFPASWLPLAHVDDGYLVVDCTGADGPTGVYRVNFEMGDTRAADSIGEVVEFWSACLVRGAWAWNPDGYWDWEPDLLPPHPHALDLV
jgi:hypothetical protein